MEMSGRVVRQTALVSLLILIIPMILFPDRLGTGLAKFSWFHLAYELLYYGVVMYILLRRVTFPKLVQAMGLCLGYRLLLGSVFGLLIAGMYSMDLSISFTLGLASYIPATLLHTAMAPFVMKPVAMGFVSPRRPRRRFSEPTGVPARYPFAEAAKNVGTPTEAAAVPAEVGGYPSANARPTHLDSPTEPTAGEANGFDRAVRYIGEDASVLLAAVVDREGLLLGRFARGNVEIEDWAPFSWLLVEANRQVLRRLGWEWLEKVDLMVKDARVIVACEGAWCLMVVAQRQVDDVLNIRINQGLETIRKYVAQRYGSELAMNAEKIYVPSA